MAAWSSALSPSSLDELINQKVIATAPVHPRDVYKSK